MLKSILISLNKIKFDRDSFKNRAFEMIKMLRPNCYEIMIEIFSMKGDQTFFSGFAQEKMKEEKYREVVFLASLFPGILNDIQNSSDFKSTLGIRRYLMAQLIEQNDVTSAKLLLGTEEPILTEDKIFLVNK